MAVTDALGERGTVTVPAGTVEYRERGSGPAIVFAHGAGAAAAAGPLRADRALADVHPGGQPSAPGQPDSRLSSHVVRISPASWMLTCRSVSSPVFSNRCGVSGGT